MKHNYSTESSRRGSGHASGKRRWSDDVGNGTKQRPGVEVRPAGNIVHHLTPLPKEGKQ